MAYTNIDDPSAYFQTALFDGTAGINNAITNDGNSDLQPDWLLFKHRTASDQDWYTVDSSRGSTQGLATNTTAAETTSSSATKDFQSFNTDGFTVGTPEDTNATNSIGTHAAWQWKCNGGSTTSFDESGANPGGTRQTNTAAGFSIISYTGTGSNGTIAHGLPSTPEFIIFKSRSATNWWATYHVGLGDDYKLALQLDAIRDSDGVFMASTLPTATNITVGGASVHTNADAGTYICYAFSPIQGYSKFGTYVGNAVVDGPFVYTGFKPACIITKTIIGSVEGWGIYDNKRSGFNVYNDALSINSQAATAGGSNYNFMDILSNGFKMRRATYGPNQSATYIYMAFAENPFVTSTGIPATAR